MLHQPNEPRLHVYNKLIWPTMKNEDNPHSMTHSAVFVKHLGMAAFVVHRIFTIVSVWPLGKAGTCVRLLWLAVCDWSKSGWSRARCQTGSCSGPVRTCYLWSETASYAWNLDCSWKVRERGNGDKDGEVLNDRREQLKEEKQRARQRG